MTKQRSTKRALLMSALSLLLCVSMLVGTTYAWFTDEVVSGMNTIQAGNLDVELYAGTTKVEEDTELFVADLWEPGMVVYENLQVRNVGTLALKYQMTLNVIEENNLDGHKLSEVLKIAVVDEIAAGATRQEVLAAAKASDNVGTLGNFFVKGDLEAGKNSEVETIVVFWEPNANEVDNLYNANNGKITSDGKPLHITFGVNLVATQKMSEFDSFGNDYDKYATLLPKAQVNDLGAKTVNATTNDWGNGKTATAYELPFVLQFQPNETLDEAMAGAYKFYHADYVVKADRDVPANSIALLGYYKAFCDDYNGGNWVALSADQKIAAGTEIRLVDVMGGGENDGTGSIKVSYKDICQWGNDGTGFLCSAADLTGENAGTTLTVELRMYKTDADPNGSSHGNEVVPEESFVVGTYSYTFPAVKVSTSADLKKALASGAGEVCLDSDILIEAKDVESNGYGTTGIYVNGSVLNGNGKEFGAAVGATWDSAISITSGTIKNIKVTKGFRGIFIKGGDKPVILENVVVDGTTYTISCDQASRQGLKATDCTFNGWTSFAGTIGTAEFTNCSFGAGSGYNFSRPYAPTTYVGCDFAAGHRMDPRAAVTFENCTIAGAPLTEANLSTLVYQNIANATIVK